MIDLAARALRAILLDIEGTTTPIAFVHDELFPYARHHLSRFLEQHGERADVKRALEMLSTEGISDIDAAMARDSKSPGLKALQGLIWEHGYRSGDLRGQVFEDVAPAIRQWKANGYRIAIYSSGSELAQRLLFQSTPDGDLTPLIDAFFDTGVGAKRQPGSYEEIARRLRLEPKEILFISDVTDELAAAASIGCRVLLSLRPGNPPQVETPLYQTVSDFRDLSIST